MIDKLRSQNGESSLHMGIVCVVGIFLIAIGLSTFHIFTVCSYARTKVDEAVLSVAAYNIPEFYGGAREMSGQARHALGSGQFDSDVFSGDVIDQLGRSIGGEIAGNTITKSSWKIEDLHTAYNNSEGGNLNFTTHLTVKVPFKVGNLPPIVIEKRMEVSSSYAPRF